MGVPIRTFVRKRRDRALATILNAVDDLGLGDAQKRHVRTCVVDALNSYHDAVLDLLASEDDTFARNDVVLEALERIQTSVESLRDVQRVS